MYNYSYIHIYTYIWISANINTCMEKTPTLICVLACESVGMKAIRLARGHPGRLKFGFPSGIIR